VDVLELAGSTQVFEFTRLLGVTMAQHAMGVSAQANIVGALGGVLIAEAYAAGTPYEGRELEKSELREKTGIIVVGVWRRGRFEIPRPATVIHPNSVLLLAGSKEQFERYDDFVGKTRSFTAPVVILGGGRVGRAASRTFDKLGIDYRVVEKKKNAVRDGGRYIQGDAADIHALERAGISSEAPSVLITTHDDDVNIYLTIYCRKLRPDIQIISRATRDRNINKLYSVGADIVLSYASMGANRILNLLRPDEKLVLAEGLSIFKAHVPPSMTEKTLADNQIRKKTGCNVIAIHSGEAFHRNPDPDVKLKTDEELLLIGTAEAERKFREILSQS